jgi:protein-S-isoprenylcysteine O-methyltransferase Ste14
MVIDEDSAGVQVPPPFIYLSALLIGLGLEWLFGELGFGIGPDVRWAIGGILLLAGFAAGLSAMARFEAAGTDVKPWKTSSAIVETGVYRWTRNPMYLGMALILAGLAIGFDCPVALFLLVPVLAIIQTQVIAREERYLETKFGRVYSDYKARVRRWL